MAQHGLKIAPSRSNRSRKAEIEGKMSSRCAHAGATRAKKGPKWALEWPQEGPRVARRGPKAGPEGPQGKLAARFREWPARGPPRRAGDTKMDPKLDPKSGPKCGKKSFPEIVKKRTLKKSALEAYFGALDGQKGALAAARRAFSEELSRGEDRFKAPFGGALAAPRGGQNRAESWTKIRPLFWTRDTLRPSVGER